MKKALIITTMLTPLCGCVTISEMDDRTCREYAGGSPKMDYEPTPSGGIDAALQAQLAQRNYREPDRALYYNCRMTKDRQREKASDEMIRAGAEMMSGHPSSSVDVYIHNDD
jgi:hypothetical protein